MLKWKPYWPQEHRELPTAVDNTYGGIEAKDLLRSEHQRLRGSKIKEALRIRFHTGRGVCLGFPFYCDPLHSRYLIFVEWVDKWRKTEENTINTLLLTAVWLSAWACTILAVTFEYRHPECKQNSLQHESQVLFLPSTITSKQKSGGTTYSLALFLLALRVSWPLCRNCTESKILILS